MQMTDIKVLVSTRVSDDGISTRPIVAGTEDKVRTELFAGLEAEGYVEALYAEGSAPAAADRGEKFELPAGWRDMHHFKLVALAKQAGVTATTKAEAIVALEAAEKAAAEAAQA